MQCSSGESDIMRTLDPVFEGVCVCSSGEGDIMTIRSCPTPAEVRCTEEEEQSNTEGHRVPIHQDLRCFQLVPHPMVH